MMLYCNQLVASVHQQVLLQQETNEKWLSCLRAAVAAGVRVFIIVRSSVRPTSQLFHGIMIMIGIDCMWY
jgi:hypothetical protein